MPKPPNEWSDRAACRHSDPDLFFPGSGDGGALRAAQDVCHACPVRRLCDEWAIGNEKYGIWAGRSARERARIRKARGIVVPIEMEGPDASRKPRRKPRGAVPREARLRIEAGGEARAQATARVRSS